VLATPIILPNYPPHCRHICCPPGSTRKRPDVTLWDIWARLCPPAHAALFVEAGRRAALDVVVFRTRVLTGSSTSTTWPTQRHGREMLAAVQRPVPGRGYDYSWPTAGEAPARTPRRVVPRHVEGWAAGGSAPPRGVDHLAALRTPAAADVGAAAPDGQLSSHSRFSVRPRDRRPIPTTRQPRQRCQRPPGPYTRSRLSESRIHGVATPKSEP